MPSSIVCTGCRKKVSEYNMWTAHHCKYCWQKAGKKIYAYDQRNTTQYRHRYETQKTL